MTVLLVLFTLILFLTIDYFVQRSRTARAAESLQPVFSRASKIPHDVGLAQNHTWAKSDQHGDLIIGLDDLLAKLVTPIDEIILPPVDTVVSTAKRDIAVQQGGKRLEFAAPVDGRVIEVNRDATLRPAITGHDPYGSGWLVKIRPTNGGINRYLTFDGEKARTWLKEQNELVKEFFIPRMPSAHFATLQDGGLAADGLLRLFNADVWREFQQSFVTLHDHPGTSQEMAGEVSL
jgi:glycine cleavage system H protein